MKKRKVVAYTYLILGIILCLVFAGRFLPFNSYGADDTKMVIESKLNKYINYSISEEDKGTLVQYEINTRIEYGKEVLPISYKETMVNLSQIEGKYPNTVKVITQDANREEDSQYNEATGVLVIQEDSQNENEDYFVIAYYDTYTEENLERQLESKVTAKVILAEEEDRAITTEEQYQDSVTENIGELTSIHSKAQEIYNGYMKSNVINGTTYTTSYSQNEQIVVSKKEVQDSIEMLVSDTFVRIENNGEEEFITDLGNEEKLVYKSTQIKKSEVEKLLGKDGKLEITDIEGNSIVTIDENTEFSEDGTLTIDYENEPEAIRIKTSKIQEEGILNLKHSKEMKDTMTDFKNVSVKTMIQLNGKQNTQEIICPIKEAETTVDVNMSNKNWSNQQQNEVTFAINLNANTVKNNMFKNPCLQIEFPSQVEKVILGESSILYANGLALQNPYIVTNENGNLVMVVELTGEQTQYNENNLELITDVRIATSVILNKEIESTTEAINVFYSNQYTIDGSTETGNKEIPIEIENYQEETEEEIINPVFYSAIQPLTENNDDLKLTVVPTKGEIALQDGDTVYEGEYIKYNIRVTNTSEENMNDVKVVASIPEGLTYGELETNYYDYRQKYQYNFQEELREKQINIGTVKAGESVDTFYEVKVNDLAEGKENQFIDTNMNVFVGDEFAQSYSIMNNIESSEVQVFMSSMIDYSGWSYDLNLISEKQETVIVKIHLPKEFNLSEIDYINHIVEDPSSYQGDENDYGKAIYINGKEIDLNEKANITISDDNIVTANLKTNSCYSFMGQIDNSNIEKQANESTIELTSYAEVILDNNKYKSNENRIEISYQNVKVSMNSDNEGDKVKYQEKINYEVRIQNIGGLNTLVNGGTSSVYVKLEDFLPEELEPISVTYDNWEWIETGTANENIVKKEKVEDISGEITEQNGNKRPNVDIGIVIPKGETSIIKIEATAGLVYKETKIENSATVSGSEINLKTTNMIGHTILPYDYEEKELEDPDDPNTPDDPDNPSDPDSPGDNKDLSESSYSISGIVWIDKNQDGERTLEENVLNGMTIMLMDITDTNTIKMSTETDNNGRYEFSNLQKGNYLVVFRYDTNIYKLTEYQKVGVSSSNNSDAINRSINLSGQQLEVGLTDMITLNSNVTNVDVGLIENKLCDLKIDKYINKVIVKTAKGTKEYNYNNKTLAKTEIKAKEIEGATVTIEYKIVVSNIGEVEGTINKIVDYLPDGLNFSSNQNNSWSKNEKGELINTSTSNRKIEVGESIELILVATKQMHASDTGTFTNKVSILDTIDTNVENNSASAEIIVSISTGAIVYISIIICIIIISSVVISYFYKREKINSKKFHKMTFFITFIMVIIVSSYSSAEDMQKWIEENHIDRTAKGEVVTDAEIYKGIIQDYNYEQSFRYEYDHKAAEGEIRRMV